MRFAEEHLLVDSKQVVRERAIRSKFSRQTDGHKMYTDELTNERMKERNLILAFQHLILSRETFSLLGVRFDCTTV